MVEPTIHVREGDYTFMVLQEYLIIFHLVVREMEEKERREEKVSEGKENNRELYIGGLH